MKMHRPLLCLLPLLFSACGGSDHGPAQGQPEAASATRIDACSLVAADQVSQIFGVTYQKGQLQEHGTGPNEHYFSICVFNGADPSAQASTSLTVRPSPDVSDPTAALQAQIDDMRKHAVPDYTLDPVPELGPGAGWDGTSHQLTLFEPGLMMIVSAQGRAVTKEQVVNLAKAALEKLPTPAS